MSDTLFDSTIAKESLNVLLLHFTVCRLKTNDGDIR